MKARVFGVVALAALAVLIYFGAYADRLDVKTTDEPWVFWLTDSTFVEGSDSTWIVGYSAGQDTAGAGTRFRYASSSGVFVFDSTTWGVYDIYYYTTGSTVSTVKMAEDKFIPGPVLGDTCISRWQSFGADVIKGYAIMDSAFHPRHVHPDSAYSFVALADSTARDKGYTTQTWIESSAWAWAALHARAHDTNWDFDEYLTAVGEIDTTSISTVQWVQFVGDHGGSADYADSARTADGTWDFDDMLDALGAVDNIADDAVGPDELNTVNAAVDEYMVTYEASTGNYEYQAYNELTLEELQDYVGLMWASGTQTRCVVTYQDADGTMDIVVDDMLPKRSVTVTLFPEFAGCVLDTLAATGGKHTGTMKTVQDSVNTTTRYNCYNWESDEATAQYFYVKLNWQLPSDFDQWDETAAITYLYRTTAAASASSSLVLQVWENGDAGIRHQDNELASIAWASAVVTRAELGSGWASGDTARMILRMKALEDVYSWLGKVVFKYDQ